MERSRPLPSGGVIAAALLVGGGRFWSSDGVGFWLGLFCWCGGVCVLPSHVFVVFIRSRCLGRGAPALQHHLVIINRCPGIASQSHTHLRRYHCHSNRNTLPSAFRLIALCSVNPHNKRTMHSIHGRNEIKKLKTVVPVLPQLSRRRLPNNIPPVPNFVPESYRSRRRVHRKPRVLHQRRTMM